jgi:radical SAM family uncharacterized protein/radical SAM-linked protein
MSIKIVQDILPLVERPSRYLGSEINCIKKDGPKIKLSIALAFPDLYEIGTSHLGLQILYSILNHHPEIAAERVFSPGPDMQDYLKKYDIPIFSLESHKPLVQFDIIGFSLLYELNLTNMISMLDLAKIPLYASQRDLSFPLIIGGGPCACNPEPYADFFDAILVGDGEKAILEISDTYIKWRENLGDKEALLKMWSEIEGIYVPAFFAPQFDQLGFQSLLPKFSTYKGVTRTIVDDLDEAAFPDAPIVPYGKPVHDRLRLEVSRGCARGCRFCQAGMIYRPVRERSPAKLLNIFESSINATGYSDISLLSLSTGDYRCLVPLIQRLMATCEFRHIAVSLPSLRAGTLTPEIMNLVKRVRKTGFTIAPEAGSQRLRNILNKNITDKEILDTVKNAFGLGWHIIKLYFMVGLPGETDDDLKELVDLVNRIRKMRGPNSRKGQINVSVATFIPKSHTPFQWASQIPLEESREKIQWLKNNLKMPGIHFKWNNPEVSLLEGLWARGDRRLNPLLVNAYKKGCRFDGWSDHFNYSLWQRALCDEGVDIECFTTRKRAVTEPLPWDHIDAKVSKEFLIKEAEKAFDGKLTMDCREGECSACGACDFINIKPKVCEPSREGAFDRKQVKNNISDSYKKVQVSFSKRNSARYFGHLELVNIFLRAINRARIPVKFSEGFHPMPKVSFEDSLPVGLESENEKLYLTVPDIIKPHTIAKDLNAHLPEGLFVHGARLAPEKPVSKGSIPITYTAIFNEGVFDEQKIEFFKKKAEYFHTHFNGKGRLKKVDLKQVVEKIELLSPCKLQMTIQTGPSAILRPHEIIKTLFNLPEERSRQAMVIKRGTN